MKLINAFDGFLRSEEVTVIRTPVAAPKAKAHAERGVGSARRECLDRILIVSRSHLERVLCEYLAHHNTHRPHRALSQQAPIPRPIPIRLGPATLASADASDSAGFCTNTNSPHNSHRQSPIRHTAAIAAAKRRSHGPPTS